MPITVNKAINIWSIIPTLVALLVTAFGWGVTYNTMTTADAVAKLGLESVASDVKLINSQLPPLQFSMTQSMNQIAENKSSIVEVNKRVDRVVESFGDKLDTIGVNVNKIATRVEVLSTQMGERPQRTRFPVTRK